MNLYTLPSKTLIATGYERVVFGKRGPYVEFTDEQINFDALVIPSNQYWRLRSPMAYYLEYRTIPDMVMVYFQKMCVTYADYKIGRFYIAPNELFPALCLKDLKVKNVPNMFNFGDEKDLYE